MDRSGELTRRETQLQYAFELLQAGTRPTADALVAVHRGSKSSAVAVLEEFWSRWLPDRLRPSQLPEPPDPVQQALARVWRLAQDTAAAGIQDREMALKNEREALAAEQAAFNATRERLDSELARANEQVRALTQSQRDLQVQMAERDRQLADSMKDIAALTELKAQLQSRVQALETEAAGLPAARQAWARTAFERDEARAALGRIEQAHARALAAQRDNHDARMAELQTQLQGARDTATRADAQRAAAQARIARSVEAVNDADERRRLAETRAATLEGELASGLKMLEREQAQRVQLESQWVEARAQVLALESQLRAATNEAARDEPRKPRRKPTRRTPG